MSQILSLPYDLHLTVVHVYPFHCHHTDRNIEIMKHCMRISIKGTVHSHSPVVGRQPIGNGNSPSAEN